MRVAEAARCVIELYPKVFFACHQRHVEDPRTRTRVSAHQKSILDHLDDQEPTTLTGLAAHMGVTPSTMSLAIERLVRAGYVLRVRDRADGRRVHLRLSADGARIKRAGSVLDPARVRRVVGRLSAAERVEAARGLALLGYAAQLEMHSKVLFGLRSGGRRRRPAPPELPEGVTHVEDRTNRLRRAGGARGARDAGGPAAAARPRRDRGRSA
ncbi:MAG: MarR family winged helix-turn-helix transcriptional regulator [Phycisphaerae bacterium]